MSVGRTASFAAAAAASAGFTSSEAVDREGEHALTYSFHRDSHSDVHCLASWPQSSSGTVH